LIFSIGTWASLAAFDDRGLLDFVRKRTRNGEWAQPLGHPTAGLRSEGALGQTACATVGWPEWELQHAYNFACYL
jgi:hypothetical protein